MVEAGVTESRGGVRFEVGPIAAVVTRLATGLSAAVRFELEDFCYGPRAKCLGTARPSIGGKYSGAGCRPLRLLKAALLSPGAETGSGMTSSTNNVGTE
uniref:Uncharacterized protein n=1 Tax=Peronospora matthiolae TaxID=2874970 RepID=A0AAV1TMN7_9STRA